MNLASICVSAIVVLLTSQCQSAHLSINKYSVAFEKYVNSTWDMLSNNTKESLKNFTENLQAEIMTNTSAILGIYISDINHIKSLVLNGSVSLDQVCMLLK